MISSPLWSPIARTAPNSSPPSDTYAWNPISISSVMVHTLLTQLQRPEATPYRRAAREERLHATRRVDRFPRRVRESHLKRQAARIRAMLRVSSPRYPDG